MNNNGIASFSYLQPYGPGTDSDMSALSYSIFQEDGEWTYPYPDLRIAYQTGIKIDAYSSYGGIRFYNNTSMDTITFSVNDGSNNTKVYYDIEVSGDVNVTGTITQEAWQTPTLTNGWVNYGSFYTPSGYFKDKNGIVHLRGQVKSGTMSQAIFTLPTGYRPEYYVYNFLGSS